MVYRQRRALVVSFVCVESRRTDSSRRSYLLPLIIDAQRTQIELPTKPKSQTPEVQKISIA